MNRIRVHCSARSVSRSRGQTKKDALTPNVRPFRASNDAGPWRTSAKDDLPAVAAAFGADLGSVVAPDISYEEDQAILRESLVTLPGFDENIRECGLSVLEASQFQFWEFVSGSCNATVAFLEEYEHKLASGGLAPASGGFAVVGPPVDIDRKRVSKASWKALPTWDVLLPSTRRLIWAIMLVAKPRWIHTAPPCTCWSMLSRRCNKRSDAMQEQLRLKALVFIIFSVQLCEYQVRAGRFCSFEHPPGCASWPLDIVNELATQTLATGDVRFDSCAWGHRDPGNNRAYLKRQRFVANVPLATLCRRCSCQCAHQRIEGVVGSGARKGLRRSFIAGEYPVDFCHAFAPLVLSHSK